MKKSVVAILVILAVAILISPALIGRLAERSMGENLEWAARESGEVTVTSGGFDRGWLSSAGTHRVELQDGDLFSMLQLVAGPLDSEDLPVLIVSTRLDHGLIPIGSLNREGGSLAPGLGSAVSTLKIELPDGQAFDVPGTTYSKVGLSGELHSNYRLPSGSHEQADTTASWGDVDIRVTSNPSTGDVTFSGNAGSVSVTDPVQKVTLASLSFSGHQKATQYEFSVGEIEYSMEGALVATGGNPPAGLRSLSARVVTALIGDRVDGNVDLQFALEPLPEIGEITGQAAVDVIGLSATALDGIQRAFDDLDPGQDTDAVYAALESDLKAMFASGLAVNVGKLDVTLPQGTVTTRANFSFNETDPATFDWTSLLVSTEATVDISMPREMVEAGLQGNPQAAAMVGLGYLVLNGDVYEMKAELRKGLLTLNGAPMPLPLGNP